MTAITTKGGRTLTGLVKEEDATTLARYGLIQLRERMQPVLGDDKLKLDLTTRAHLDVLRRRGESFEDLFDAHTARRRTRSRFASISLRLPPARPVCSPAPIGTESELVRPAEFLFFQTSNDLR